jgi:hypothetical protein
MSILYNYAFLPLKSLACTYSYEKSKQHKKRGISDLSRQAWISSLTISIDSTAGDEASCLFVYALEVLQIVRLVYDFTLSLPICEQIPFSSHCTCSLSSPRSTFTALLTPTNVIREINQSGRMLIASSFYIGPRGCCCWQHSARGMISILTYAVRI